MSALWLCLATTIVVVACAGGGTDSLEESADGDDAKQWPDASEGSGGEHGRETGETAGAGGEEAEGSVAGAPNDASGGGPSAEKCVEGTACGARTCGDYGGCSYDSTCTNSGSRTRDCNDYVCTDGACVPVPVQEIDTTGCGRNTDGTSCGSKSCDSCSYTGGSCDKYAERYCTTYSCGGGSCNSNGAWTGDGCGSRTLACSAGTEEICYIVTTDGCGTGSDKYCQGHRTCSGSCTWGSCIRDSVGGCACS